MAEATDLLLLPFEDPDDFDEDDPQHLETLDLDAFTLAAEGFDSLVPDISLSLSLRPPRHRTPSDYASDSDSDSMYPEDVSSLAFDLFNRCPSPPLDDLDLGLGLPSRPMLEIQNDECDDGSDWSPDEFFLGSEAIEFSGARHANGEDGPGILQFDSDSDNGQISCFGDEENIPFGWDLGAVNDGRRELSEEFEWEEVLDEEEEVYTDRWEEPEVLSMLALAEEYASNASDAVDALREDVELIQEVELILSTGFVYTSDHDILIGLSEQESSIRGAPPAARSVVENLPSVVLTAEDVAKNNTNCAVCKDEIPINKSVKKLPCSHYYHEECILPWLEIRNTCPICRFELLTDDPEYEKLKARLAGNGVLSEEGQVR